MSNHPLNLLLRFLLELASWTAIGIYFFHMMPDNIAGNLIAILITLLYPAVWGIFRVPNDPGKAPVPVPGIVRLLIELITFGSATFALWKISGKQSALLFLSLLVIHHLLSTDRIRKMIKPNNT